MLDDHLTDVSRADSLLKTYQKSEQASIKPKLFYNWNDLANLFEDGIISQESLQITDPTNLKYIIVRL